MKTQVCTIKNNPPLKAFVETFIKDVNTQPVIKHIVGKSANHELWRCCTNCGTYNDRRKTSTCEECGEKL